MKSRPGAPHVPEKAHHQLLNRSGSQMTHLSSLRKRVTAAAAAAAAAGAAAASKTPDRIYYDKKRLSHPQFSEVPDHEPHAGVDGLVVGVFVEKNEDVLHVHRVLIRVESGPDRADQLAQRLSVSWPHRNQRRTTTKKKQMVKQEKISKKNTPNQPTGASEDK